MAPTSIALTTGFFHNNLRKLFHLKLLEHLHNFHNYLNQKSHHTSARLQVRLGEPKCKLFKHEIGRNPIVKASLKIPPTPVDYLGMVLCNLDDVIQL